MNAPGSPWEGSHNSLEGYGGATLREECNSNWHDLPISEGGDNKEEGVHASQKSKKKRGKKEELEAEMLALQKRQQEILAHMMTDNSDADSDLGISLNVSGVAPCHDTVEDFDMASFEQSEFDLPQMSGGDTSDTAVFGAACHHPSFPFTAVSAVASVVASNNDNMAATLPQDVRAACGDSNTHNSAMNNPCIHMHSDDASLEGAQSGMCISGAIASVNTTAASANSTTASANFATSSNFTTAADNAIAASANATAASIDATAVSINSTAASANATAASGNATAASANSNAGSPRSPSFAMDGKVGGGGHVPQGRHDEEDCGNDEDAQGAFTELQGADGTAAGLPWYTGPQGVAAGGAGGGSARSFDVDKLSYKQPLFHDKIRALLQEYTISPHDEYAGTRNSLDVFKSNLSYYENFDRQLSNSDELCQKAYILDDNNPHSRCTLKPKDVPQPSSLNLPGKVKNLQILQQFAGEQQLCYLGCDWGKGLSTTLDKNPENLRVWVFYHISMETANEVNRLKKIKDKDEYKKESTASSFNAKKDLGPGLYVVLPIGDPQPVKRARDLIQHEFTTGLIERLQNERGFLRSTRQRGGKLLSHAFA